MEAVNNSVCQITTSPPIPPFPTLKEKKYFTYPLIQHRRPNWNNALNEVIIDKVFKHLEELFAFYQLGFSYQSYGGSEMLLVNW